MTAKEMEALQFEANKAFQNPDTRLSKNMTIHRQRYINKHKNKNKNKSNTGSSNGFKKGGIVRKAGLARRKR